MRIPIILTALALVLSACNANQAINPSGQASLCANDPSCNPYNPSSYAQRRHRPLSACRAAAGRGGEAFIGRHRCVWVFLGPPHLATKTPVYEGWISLDSLVRIE
jgi:hypothetical protein